MRMLRTTQRNARIAAILLTAASPLIGAFPAAAQQMAANTAANFTACDQIKDPAKSAQCSADVSLNDAKAKFIAAKAREAVIDKRIASADDSIACAKFLLSKKATGVALDPTRLNREKGCIYARELGMQ